MDQTYDIDVQGHRGCRGILPENTIPGFKKALELGVTTLELDVVITKDHQVLISHDPFFHHKISTDPNGLEIEESNELDHKVYEKDYSEIKNYDVGLKKHVDYPHQTNMPVHKPSLFEMVKAIEEFNEQKNKKKVFYNIELKRRPEWDQVFLPDVNTFVDLVISTIHTLGIEKRTSLQCFDVECLQILKAKQTEMPLVYLIENMNSLEKNLERLGFTPEIYSPHYKLVTAQLAQACRSKNMQLIPWTVNETNEMERLIDLRVDGIISDYPDRLINLIEEKDGIGIK